MGSKNNDAQIAALNKGIAEQEKARERLDAVETPDYDQIKDYIEAAAAENPNLIGLMQQIERDPSALEDIVNDPSLRDAQTKALQSLTEAGESGFSESDMAERRELARDVESGEQARQSSILQQMAQRGQSGSGAELAARLSSSQAATQRAAEATDRLATDSSAARRQALLQASQAAGNLRNQDRAEATQVASAKDQIAQFNAMNRQNIGNQNLQLRQGMENQRSAQQQNKYSQLGNLQQQQFANDMQKAGAYAQATAPISQMQTQNYRQSQGPMGMIGTLAGAGIGGSLGGAQGAQLGASLGGALGNATQSNRAAYADGGIGNKYSEGSKPNDPNRHYSDIMRDKKMQEDFMLENKYGGNRYQQAMGRKQNPSITTEEAFSAGKQKLRELGGGLKDMLTPSPSAETKPETGMLDVLQNILPKTSPEPRQKQPEMTAPIDPIDYKQLGARQLIAADGGPKYGGITDAQADQLRAELDMMNQKYANGGTKYGSMDDYKSMGYDDITGRDTEMTPDLAKERNRILRELIEKDSVGVSNDAFTDRVKLTDDEKLMLHLKHREKYKEDPSLKRMYEDSIIKNIESGKKYAHGGVSMAHNDGGEGTIIDSGEENYAGDELEDRINDGELVLNIEQQDRINDKLMELKRLKSLKRTDTMIDEGEKEVNRDQQESLMSIARGEMDVEELPNDRIVKEPTGGMGELMALLRKPKRS